MKLLLWLSVLIIMSFPANSEATENDSTVIFGAMQEEMNRSLKNLKIENFYLYTKLFLFTCSSCYVARFRASIFSTVCR